MLQRGGSFEPSSGDGLRHPQPAWRCGPRDEDTHPVRELGYPLRGDAEQVGGINSAKGRINETVDSHDRGETVTGLAGNAFDVSTQRRVGVFGAEDQHPCPQGGEVVSQEPLVGVVAGQTEVSDRDVSLRSEVGEASVAVPDLGGPCFFGPAGQGSALGVVSCQRGVAGGG